MKDNATKASKSGNSYTAWRDVSPEHNRLVDAILQSDIDVIVTTRAKAEYVMEQEGGKTTVKKVGLAPIFREGLEYELTVFFDLSQEHIATASKDRTGLFDGQNFKPTVETGKQLIEWRDGGEVAKPDTQPNSGNKLGGKTNYNIIADMIKGTEFTMDDVAEYIESTYGKSIALNDLTETQFKKVSVTLQKNIDVQRKGGNE